MSFRNSQLAVAAAALLLTSACYTTTYHNFDSRPPASEVTHTERESEPPKSWRHFWLYGWIPAEIVIDTAEACGGAEHVKRLETEQTFIQGLITAFASAEGVNIYAPYGAQVVCDHSPKE